MFSTFNVLRGKVVSLGAAVAGIQHTRVSERRLLLFWPRDWADPARVLYKGVFVALLLPR